MISDNKGNICIPGSSNNIPSIDNESAQILNLIHGTGWFKEAINHELSVNICKIPLASQIQLLKFMSEPNNGRFDHLQKTLQKIDDEPLKIKLLENFAAAEFGNDFGDTLLDIANSTRFSNKQKTEIMDGMSSMRASISEISSLFNSFPDSSFAKSLAKASNERLTDALTAFDIIGKDGYVTADLGIFFGKAEFNYREAIEALNYEKKSLEIISGTIQDITNGKEGVFAEKIISPQPPEHERTMYSFYSPEPGYVLLYTRPEGSHSFNPSFEYGKTRSRYSMNSSNGGVEASISFTVNPKDPFSLPNPFKSNYQKTKNPYFYDPATMDKISAIRLDREGRAPNESAMDPNRDPINPIGTISLDLSSINNRSDTPSGKVSRLIAAGNQIRSLKKGTEYTINHNIAYFDQNTYGTASGFRQLVEFIDSLAGTWCKKMPPKSNEGFLGLVRQEKRKRGQKAMTKIDKESA